MNTRLMPPAVLHEASRLLRGYRPNCVLPADQPLPWRGLLGRLQEAAGAGGDAEQVRQCLLRELALLSVSHTEEAQILTDVATHDADGPADPDADADWFMPEPLSDLMQAQFPDLRFAVPGMIQEGVTLFAAPPKLGKTLLMLHVGLGVALGGWVFGAIKVEQGEVLFLSLEDGRRRVQTRMRKLLAGTPAPASFRVLYSSKRLNDGLVARLGLWMEQHPETRLIVIDTFARVRDKTDRDGILYQQDYDAIAPLQEFAKAQRIAVVLIHHTKKGSSDDVLEMVSGSNGLTGVADAVLLLQRGRGENESILHVIGKDMEEETAKAIAYDTVLGTYKLLGDAADVLRSKERTELLSVLRGSNEPLSIKDVALQVDKPYATVKQRLWQMAQAGEVVRVDGKYTVPAGAQP